MVKTSGILLDFYLSKGIRRGQSFDPKLLRSPRAAAEYFPADGEI